MKIARLPFLRLGHAGSIVLIVVSTVGAHAQTTLAPIKQGLWQTQMTMSMQVTLPPDVEAKIAAMPAAQHRADRCFHRWRARADHFGPDQTGVVADPDDHVDAGDAAAGRGGKNCGDAGGAASC